MKGNWATVQEVVGVTSDDPGGDVCAAEEFVSVSEETDGSAEGSVYDAAVKTWVVAEEGKAAGGGQALWYLQ